MERIKKIFISGYALAVLASIGFSFKAILVKLGYGLGVDATTLMGMRIFIAMPVIIGSLILIEGKNAFKISAKELALFALMGVGGLGCAMLFSFYSLELIDASLSTLVVFTYPAMTVMLLMAFTGKRATGTQLLSLCVSFIGIMLVVRVDKADFFTLNAKGVLLSLAAAFCFAAYNAVSEKVLTGVSPVRLSSYCMMFLGGFYAAAFGTGPYPTDLKIWTIAAVLAIFTGFLPFLLFLYSIRSIGAGRTVIVNSIGPALTVLWGYLLLGERLDTVQALGMVMVVAAVMALKLKNPLKLLTGSGAEFSREVTGDE